MQLILNGTQDMCITGNPQITYFKAVHRRHTNFAIESIKQTFNGNPTIPLQQNTNSSNFIISRTGDLIHRMYLEYHNDISGNLNLEQSTSTYRFNSGVNNMSSRMIKDVSIQIGDQQIDKHYGEWLEIFAELTEPNPTGSSLSEIKNNIPENDIKSISCGANHTAILTKDGKVLTFGSNTESSFNNNISGQLGRTIGGTNNQVPMEISGNDTDISGIIAVSCGGAHTAILTEEGKVLTFGSNSQGGTITGQLGRTVENNNNFDSEPTVIPNLTNCIAVSCGGSHTAILKNNGTVFTFGEHSVGQLGQGNITSNILTPIEISGNHTDIIAVSCGEFHTAILKNNGTVLTFGLNNMGQLGINSTFDAFTPMEISGNHTDIIAVSCGNAHTAILKSNGTVFTSGNTFNGQLGRDDDNFNIPMEISGNHTDIIAISCGGDHTAILTKDGEVFTFGKNDVGQLGLGDSDTQVSSPTVIPNLTNCIAVSCGGAHTAILTKDGKVFTFGLNTNLFDQTSITGQLGRDVNNSNPFSEPHEITTSDVNNESNYSGNIRTLFNTLKFVSDSYPTSGTLFQKMSKMGGTKNSSYLNRDQTFVPLRFWFNRNIGLALPLIALQNHEVKLLLTLNGQDICHINSGTNISLWVDYIFLDKDERRRFARTSHQYLIEQLQRNEIKKKTENILNFNYPVKELIWKQGENNITDTNWTLNFNGKDRFIKRPTKYFTRTQVWQHHTGYGGVTIPDSIAVYSFSIKPESHQPTGVCNFTRIDEVKLLSDLELTNEGTIYAVNYNILKIMSGMAGVSYIN